MTYTIVALIRRKEGTTPTHFRAYYDNIHVPLLQSLVGASFPISHTRHYVVRTNTMPSIASSGSEFDPDIALQLPRAGEAPSAQYLPVMYRGEPHQIDYDSLTMMVWEDKAAFDTFKEIFYDEEVQARLFADEKNFLDHGLRITYAIEEPVVTGRLSNDVPK